MSFRIFVASQRTWVAEHPVSKIMAIEKYAFSRLLSMNNPERNAESCGDLFIMRGLLNGFAIPIRMCSRGPAA